MREGVGTAGQGTGTNVADPEQPQVVNPKENWRRPPSRVELEEVVPWPEPVNAAILLDVLVALLNRFVVFPKWVAEMLALWVLHTFAYHLRDVTTYLAIESPEKECGKWVVVPQRRAACLGRGFRPRLFSGEWAVVPYLGPGGKAPRKGHPALSPRGRKSRAESPTGCPAGPGRPGSTAPGPPSQEGSAHEPAGA